MRNLKQRLDELAGEARNLKGRSELADEGYQTGYYLGLAHAYEKAAFLVRQHGRETLVHPSTQTNDGLAGNTTAIPAAKGEC